MLLLAAEYVGVRTAPVSPAYSLVSMDFIRLRGVADLTPPAALFVQDGKAFAPACIPGTPVIAAGNAGDGQLAWADLARAELAASRCAAAKATNLSVRDSHLGRVLFTSSSTR